MINNTITLDGVDYDVVVNCPESGDISLQNLHKDLFYWNGWNVLKSECADYIKSQSGLAYSEIDNEMIQEEMNRSLKTFLIENKHNAVVYPHNNN